MIWASGVMDIVVMVVSEVVVLIGEIVILEVQ